MKDQLLCGWIVKGNVSLFHGQNTLTLVFPAYFDIPNSIFLLPQIASKCYIKNQGRSSTFSLDIYVYPRTFSCVPKMHWSHCRHHLRLPVAPSILKSSGLVNQPVISGESVILLFLKCEPAGMDTCCMVTERSQVSAPGD